MNKTKNPWGMDSNGTVTEKARSSRFAKYKRGVHNLPEVP